MLGTEQALSRNYEVIPSPHVSGPLSTSSLVTQTTAPPAPSNHKPLQETTSTTGQEARLWHDFPFFPKPCFLWDASSERPTVGGWRGGRKEEGTGRVVSQALQCPPKSPNLWGVARRVLKCHRTTQSLGLKQKSSTSLYLKGTASAPAVVMRARRLGLGEMGDIGMMARAEMLRAQGLHSLQQA